MRQAGTVIHYREVNPCGLCGSIACSVASVKVCRHTNQEREVTYLSDTPEAVAQVEDSKPRKILKKVKK